MFIEGVIIFFETADMFIEAVKRFFEGVNKFLKEEDVFFLKALYSATKTESGTANKWAAII